jgi:hypothetical protein
MGEYFVKRPLKRSPVHPGVDDQLEGCPLGFIEAKFRKWERPQCQHGDAARQ